MKINIFYPRNTSEMDIITTGNMSIKDMPEYLKKKNIEWDAIVYGIQIYGWSREIEWNVIKASTKNELENEIGKCINRYPHTKTNKPGVLYNKESLLKESSINNIKNEKSTLLELKKLLGDKTVWLLEKNGYGDRRKYAFGFSIRELAKRYNAKDLSGGNFQKFDLDIANLLDNELRSHGFKVINIYILSWVHGWIHRVVTISNITESEFALTINEFRQIYENNDVDLPFEITLPDLDDEIVNNSIDKAFDAETKRKHPDMNTQNKNDVDFMMRHDLYLHQQMDGEPDNATTNRKIQDLKRIARTLTDEQLQDIVNKTQFTDKRSVAKHELRKREILHPKLKR